MTHTRTVTKDNSADLGFAHAAMLHKAVTKAAFRAGAQAVVLERPDDELPPYRADLMLAPDERPGPRRSADFSTLPFNAYDPLLDGGTNTAAALAALNQRPAIHDCFAKVFPALTLPIGDLA